MTTIVLIKEAILAMKDRTGSSIPAINKWIEAEKNVSNFDSMIFAVKSISRAAHSKRGFCNV